MWSRPGTGQGIQDKKVNDRASFELMREFYRNLKTAKKSEALRQAQLKTMEQFPEPFYWAAYQLTGES